MTPETAIPRWRELVRPYCAPATGKGLWQLATTLPALVTLEVLALLALEVSLLLTLSLDVLAAGFLVRAFILQHDCGHGSFLPSQRWNDRIGTALGFVTLTPYFAWRHDHAIHHATTGDLDRRGTGDIAMLTVDEYLALSPLGRLRYRLFRNPFVMFLVGAVFVFFLSQRSTKASRGRRYEGREARSVRVTNLAGGALLLGIWALGGWQALLLVHFPTATIAGVVGVFLFYVQHQFEGTYWRRHADWDFASASLRGSTYLKLPGILRFLTADIGIHQIHHLAPKIPNYELKRCLDDNPPLQEVETLGVRDALATVRLKLYDEERDRMVSWRDVHRR